MKNISLALKAVAIASLVSAAGMAAAAGTNQLTVNASITGKCTFNSTTSTLNFGAIDPAAAGPALATQTPLPYRCTKGVTTAAIAPSTGTLARTLTSTTSVATMAYTLVIGSTAATGLGFGSGGDLTTTLDGSILATSYQNAPAETFREVLVLNINP